MPYPRIVMYSLAPVVTGGGGGVLTLTDHGYISNNPAATIGISGLAGNFTPTRQYVLAVGAAWLVGGGGPMTIADTFGDTGGGTWTQILTVSHNFSPDTPTVTAWYRKLGTGAGSGDVVLTSHAVTADAIAISVMEVGGASATNPVPTGQTVTSDTSLTTVTNTLPSALFSTNSLVVTGYFDIGAFTQVTPNQTGYTLWQDANMGGDGLRAFYKNGSANQVTSFSSTESSNPNLGFAFEIS